MHQTLLFGVGLALTSLLLFIPALYMRAWSGLALPVETIALIGLPLPVLAAGILGKRHWLLLWAFPSSHLLALSSIPELTHSRLYQGAEGLAAFAVLGTVGVIYYAIALRSPDPQGSDTSPEVFNRSPQAAMMNSLTFFVAFTILGCFLWNVFYTPTNDRISANLTVLAGLFVTWFFLEKLWIPRLVVPVLEDTARKGMLQEVLFVHRANKQQLLSSVVVVVLTLSMLLVFDSIM
jgi:hypothetical protein